MDDSVILVKDKATAIEVLEKSRVFLRENLGLELNKKTQIFKSKQGSNRTSRLYKICRYL